MRKIYVTMALSLVCAMSLHAEKKLYGVKEDINLLKLYYDDQYGQRGGSATTDWKTAYASQVTIVSLDESIQYISGIDATTDIEFTDFYNLVYIEHLEYFHHNAMNTDYMFQNCRNLKWVDLSGFDFTRQLSGGGAMSMFEGCSALTTIYCDADMSGDQMRFDRYMFTGCENLVGSNGTTFNSNYTASVYARPDKPGQPGYFTPTSQRIVCGLVTSCHLQGLNWNALKPGVVWTEELEQSLLAGIQPTSADALYYADGIRLVYYTDDFDFEDVEYGTALEERQCALLINAVINNTDEHGQRFSLPKTEGAVTFTVDGKVFEVSNSGVTPFGHSCDCIGKIIFTPSAQGIESVQSGKVQGTKILRDGQLLIQRNGKTFTAQGAEMK